MLLRTNVIAILIPTKWVYIKNQNNASSTLSIKQSFLLNIFIFLRLNISVTESMASLRTTIPFWILSMLLLFTSMEAREYVVGGNNCSWEIPISSAGSLQEWARTNRFFVGDILSNIIIHLMISLQLFSLIYMSLIIFLYIYNSLFPKFSSSSTIHWFLCIYVFILFSRDFVFFFLFFFLYFPPVQLQYIPFHIKYPIIYHDS